ncbi:hypothetical protein QUA85_11305 [Microcoleus sp. F8-C4]
MGSLVTLSQSAHLYDDTFETADRVIGAHYDRICNARDFFDPAGNFIIELVTDKDDEHGEKILVTQIPGSGKTVSYYSGGNALKLVREISAASPAIKTEHIGYLGVELQKAAHCLKIPTLYTQDL